MKKTFFLSLITLFVMSSCVSKKEYTSLENRHKKTQDLLNTATIKLNACLEEKTTSETLADAYKEQIADLKITRIQDALNRKDSVTFALVTSLKKEIGINDPDIEVNVDKAVVFISLSDKLLFKTGSYEVSDRAKEILGKVATVVNGKPDFECMVEGHTDSRSYERGVLIDNWDLSVKRATSIVRVLEDLDVNPGRLIAAGRSFYDPLVDNDTAENRATNRRTRIIIMPKIDQFYDMIEKEMQNLSN